jgi:peptidoglycan L-alanyl-D-glutamate endopeptidase CwlK
VNIYVLRLQKLVNLAGYSPALKEDGEYGPKTEAGVSWLDNRVRVFPKMPVTAPEQKDTFDSRTEKNIATLHPKAQILARQFMTEVHKAGIHAKIISGSRTFQEQQVLFDQARDKKDNDGDGRVDEPDETVTKARPGFSWHNYALAFDIGIFDDTGDYLEESPDYSKAGIIGEALGLEWGGRWTFKDEPHFQLRPDSVKGMKDHEAFAVLREKVRRGESVV